MKYNINLLRILIKVICRYIFYYRFTKVLLTNAYQTLGKVIAKIYIMLLSLSTRDEKPYMPGWIGVKGLRLSTESAPYRLCMYYADYSSNTYLCLKNALMHSLVKESTCFSLTRVNLVVSLHKSCSCLAKGSGGKISHTSLLSVPCNVVNLLLPECAHVQYEIYHRTLILYLFSCIIISTFPVYNINHLIY